MRKHYTYSYSWILIIALAITVNSALAFGLQLPARDTLNYFLNSKKTKKKGPISFALPPIKPVVTSSIKTPVRTDDKLLSSVEVYPNPITDQINLKYVISRNSNVSIKMMDVLGNNVITLFSQRVEPGEQTFSYYLNNKLSRGFYFIRVVAGTEFVIRRVSIL
ncbi:MAG TPA: T9SS type A sorting domain-containing protein [Mucilaginibacter sp.]